jgi:hypothetical protein
MPAAVAVLAALAVSSSCGGRSGRSRHSVSSYGFAVSSHGAMPTRAPS